MVVNLLIFVDFLTQLFYFAMRYESVICLVFLFHHAFSDTRENKVFSFVPDRNSNIDFDSNEDILNHERYARHVQAITESVVDHIVKELKTRFPEVNKRMSRHKINQIAEDLNTMIRILKRKRIRTNKFLEKKAENGTKRSPIFWKNKLLFVHNNFNHAVKNNDTISNN